MRYITLIRIGLCCTCIAFSVGRAAETQQMLEIDAMKAVAEYQRTHDVAAISRVVPELNAAFAAEQGRAETSRFASLISISSKLIGALYATADASFNAEKKPSLNSGSPGGQYSSGTDPKSIKEPDLRAAYEKRIAQDRQYAEYYQQQSRILRTVDELAQMIGEKVGATADQQVRGSLARSGMEPRHIEDFLGRVKRSRLR